LVTAEGRGSFKNPISQPTGADSDVTPSGQR
jgi:hypothetical protein